MPRKLRGVLVGLCVIGGVAASILLYRPEPKAQHVLLVVFDTLRADRLSIYGHDKETTPFLLESKSQWLKFTHAKAVSPWTMPSHASIFTGLMPSAHRAQWGRIHLDPEFTTLAETLRTQGFETVSIASNPFFEENFGLTQGFVDHSVVKGPGKERSAKTLARLPEIIDNATKDEGRLFLFLNFMDTHIRYNHYEYGRQFGLDGRPLIWNGEEKWKVSALEREFTREDRQNHGAAYDAAVRYLDDIAQEIMSILQEKNILDQTLVIFTSDHGEGLGYHQEMGHSISVWEEQLAIPLLIRFPDARRGGEVVSKPVSLLGLAPFILDNLGVARPEPLRDAPSLEDRAGRPVCADYRSYFVDTARQTNIKMAQRYPELSKTVRPRHVVYCGMNKLVVDDLGGLAFYDVEDDPHEQSNLAETASPAMEQCLLRYRDMLEKGRFTSFSDTGPRGERDQEQDEIELEALKALGYVH